VIKDQYLIFPRASLEEIFFVSLPNENMDYKNKIDLKHVDFLLCDAVTLKPALRAANYLPFPPNRYRNCLYTINRPFRSFIPPGVNL
jgi:hypothetical protein